MPGLMWSLKFSQSQHLPLLLVWCSCEFCYPTWGLPEGTLSIQEGTISSRHLILASIYIECEAMWEDEVITSQLLMTTPNNVMWTGYLVFIIMNMNLSSDWLKKKKKKTKKQKRYSIPFPNFWRSESSHVGDFLKNRATDSRLLHSRQNLKEIKRMREITDLNNLPITLCIYIYIYWERERESEWERGAD